VGIGTLAGSTVMLLAVAWGGSLWVGRCDFDARGVAKERTLTRQKKEFFSSKTFFLGSLYCDLVTE
jgi:hypothetical protein